MLSMKSNSDLTSVKLNKMISGSYISLAGLTTYSISPLLYDLDLAFMWELRVETGKTSNPIQALKICLNPSTANQINCRLLYRLLVIFNVNFANSVDRDQTAPRGAV